MNTKKIENLTFFIFVLIMLLFSLHYLINYNKPEIVYPFSKDANIQPLLIDSAIQEVGYPIEMKSVIDYTQGSPNEETIESLYDIEFIGHAENDFSLSSIQLFEEDRLISYNAELNGVPLELTKKNVEVCSVVKGINMLTGEYIRDCKESVSYVLPELFLEGNQRINKLVGSFTLTNNLHKGNILKVPLFFKKDIYSIYIFLKSIPGKILISPDNSPSKVYTTFTLNKNDYYHIVKHESGWVTRYAEQINDKLITAPLLTKNQTSELKDDKLSNEINIGRDNMPQNFLILLIPNIKIFLLPLIFLWTPILFNHFTKRKIWKRILMSYIIIIGIIGIGNFNGLHSLNIISYSFNFFNGWFISLVYLFPLLYIGLFNLIFKKIKDRV